jgi:hypothetical protein
MLRRWHEGRPALLIALATALPATAASAADAATLTGSVTAAGAPVASTNVTLYAAGSVSPVQLATTTTDSAGDYSLSYDAPANTRVLYVVAAGGSAVAPTLRLMASAPVSAASPAPGELPISEQTTVASAFSFAPFLRADRGVAPALTGPAPGLPNAALSIPNLVEPSTAKVSFTLAGAPNGTATDTLATFNTVAALLSACATSGTTVPTSVSPGCRAILAAATPPGGRRPSDTLQVALAIAQHQTLRPAALYRLAPTKAFRPQLTAAPSSWLLPIVFVGNGLNAPGRMAFDSAGTVWAGNNFAAQGTTAGTAVTHLDAGGQPLPGSPSSGGGITAPGFGTSVDATDRVWIGNYPAASMTLLNADGTPTADSPYTQGPLKNPQGIAISPANDVWIASFGTDSVVVYPKGDPSRSRSITGPGIARPFSIALDASGTAWVTTNALTAKLPGSISRIAADGTVLPTITGGGLRSPIGVAFDSTGVAWVGNFLSDSITRITADGKARAIRVPAAFGSWGVAVDGSDHVWVAGFQRENVTELTNAGTPVSSARTGFTSKAFQHITAVQIDPSGNVWLANNWSSGSPLKDFVGGNGLVKLVGAATPVRTPLIGLPQRP